MFHSIFSPTQFGRFWRHKAGAVVLLLVVLLLGAGTAASSTLAIPTISITSVKAGESVTIQTYNYPAGQTFTVRMNAMGTLGAGGTIVGSLDSGAGGSMSATFPIPDGLKANAQIAIRLDSPQGYYSYNWFYNNTTGTVVTPGNPGPIYTGIPTFKITAVTEGKDVTIETNNFPANMSFNVTMGKMYTRGIGGISVGTLNSGNGGTLTATFEIPAELVNDNRISIRAQTAHANPFYAYNWFYNNSTDVDNNNSDSGNSNSGNGTGGATAVYTGIPTFTVCTVNKDSEVTILTKNFPTNQSFAVTMGPMYTSGIGGYYVKQLENGDKASDRYTFTIPTELKGSYRISIRTQTAHAYPYYSYNWFYNNSTTMDHCQ
ncbi:MAG: hypothetical protein H6652_25400 [Ardenticatenaceae bacterium]|nr:hypothetical protein [Ardenticatenaceae bacterium]MCB8950217.1 hypothetical protein [Ardenticatenaceae bacterium]